MEPARRNTRADIAHKRLCESERLGGGGGTARRGAAAVATAPSGRGTPRPPIARRCREDAGSAAVHDATVDQSLGGSVLKDGTISVTSAQLVCSEGDALSQTPCYREHTRCLQPVLDAPTPL